MKKAVLTETCLIILILGISIGLYQIFYGIDLSCNNYFDMMTFELRRAYVIYGIISIFFLPIYISINVIRLIYFKFLKLYITVEIIISALMWMIVFFLHYQMLGSDGVVPAKEGWTIYPPLSSLPQQLRELDLLKLERERNLQLIIIAIIFVSTLTLTMVTVRCRKKHVR